MTEPRPAGAARRFYVRTYGCQMNEHDSERIAGLLAADGMEATDDLAEGGRAVGRGKGPHPV